jgi:energy-coupling factor transporter ATP-binding protein EcfA2
MITRLEVDGFKSLQGFAVDLEPFTVFIGPNGAGKSNILEALALLSRLGSEPIVDAFRHGRGRPRDQFSRFGGEVAREMRFAVEFSGDGVSFPIRYELSIERVARSSGAERLMVREEKLAWLPPGTGTWTVAHALSRETASEQEMATLVPLSFKMCQWIRLDLAHLSGPSDRVDTGALRPDGSNLPTVLADLSPQLVGEIRADLVALVPGLAGFAVVHKEDSFEIEFQLSGGEIVPARLISDGTLRALALLTAIRLEPRPSLIGIEEPENGIYPGRLRKLVELLREHTADQGVDASQILLTTHSPVILAVLRNHPQHLRYVDTVHRDLRRATRARVVGHPSKENRHLVVAPREIDQLLHAATTEGSE